MKLSKNTGVIALSEIAVTGKGNVSCFKISELIL